MKRVEEIEREEAREAADQDMFNAECVARPTPLETQIRARYSQLIAATSKRFGPVGMERGGGLTDIGAFDLCVVEFEYVPVVRALKLASARAKELSNAYWRSRRGARR